MLHANNLLSLTYYFMVFVTAHTANYITEPNNDEDHSWDTEGVQETVRLDFYYECLCPYSVDFYVDNFVPVVQKLNQHLDVHTYPYGNAKMSKDNDGHVVIECQHGERECYGNKLHVCAIDILKDVESYVTYNGCLMQNGSSDDAADQCGKTQNVPSDAIKKCANGKKGEQLLEYYGHESRKTFYQHVPHVLINKQKYDENNNFMHDVCAAFKQPPKECQK